MIAKRLSRTRRHHEQDVLRTDHGLANRALVRTEVGEAENGVQELWKALLRPGKGLIAGWWIEKTGLHGLPPSETQMHENCQLEPSVG